jgi:DNA-binding response OmpR family regulator
LRGLAIIQGKGIAMLGKDREVSVILNTAYSQYKDNFMTWGAEAYVIKSSDLTELRQKMREVLEERKKPTKSRSKK